MEVKGCRELKKNLINSKDIFNLLANLYVVCSDRFTSIHNLTSNYGSFRSKFRDYQRRYLIELQQILGKTDDLFSTDFPHIIHPIEIMKDNGEEEFLIAIWAYFSAVDLVLSNDKIYLNTFNSIFCKASDCFGAKEYRLLFKPKNLIFSTIKDKLSQEGQEKTSEKGLIKTGIDIGQRIGDRLQNLIFYDSPLSRKIEIKKIEPVINQLLLDQGTNLAFAVAPVSCDYQYSFKRFNITDGGVPFVFESIENRATIEQCIDKVLNRCLEEDVHILILPELTIDGELRGHISDWLKLNNSDKKIIMVIAGSWHILTDNQKESYVNRSVVFGFDGQVLWEQEKMNQFQLDTEDINKLRSSSLKGLEEFQKLFNGSDTGGWEKIDISDTLKIYDSSIGRMAITICLDYFVKERTDLQVGPNVNLIFVPAMSPTVGRMKRANFDSGTWGLASVFCTNSCWIITGGDIDRFNAENAGFIYTPKHGGLVKTQCTGDCLKCNFPILRVSEMFGKDEKDEKGIDK